MKKAFVNKVVKNKIATIEFYSPASNSLNSEQLLQLTNAILSCKKNLDVAVIHLKSAGEKAFCAGASFDELLAIENLDTGVRFFMGFANVINAIRTCDKLVITSIQGKTVGGGVGIAAASDYVFATKNASIKLSELSIGIGPFVIAPAVNRKIGLVHFTRLSLNPTLWQTAAWANTVGLYQHVEPTLEKLNHHVLSFLEELVSYHPKALSEMKKTFWSGTADWETLLAEKAKISGTFALSEQTKAALTRFKKK